MTLQQSPMLNDEQEQILKSYQYGYALIRAVPGSGKTTLLSYLAASAAQRLKPGQKILVVTYTRSAALNALRRIETLVHPDDAPKFIARTLHGFAADVLSSYDPSYAEKRLYDDVDSFVRYQEAFRKFASKETSLYEAFRRYTGMHEKEIPEHVRRFVRIIRQNYLEINEDFSNIDLYFPSAKDFTPYEIVVPFIIGVYRQYFTIKKSELAYDYDDMVLDALRLLRENREVRQKLSEQTGFIFEDEAQDSTHAQSMILQLIAGPLGNWVRIGDENQAILSSFTASRHDTFSRHLELYPFTQVYTLSKSPRYSQAQIERINALIRWFNDSDSSHIAKSFADVRLVHGGHESNSELDTFTKQIFSDENKEQEYIVNTALSIISKHKHRTCGILCATNRQVEELYQRFQKRLGAQTSTYVSVVGGPPYGLWMYIESLYTICDFLLKPNTEKIIRQMVMLINPDLIIKNEQSLIRAISVRLQGETPNRALNEEEEEAYNILKDILHARLFSPVDFVLFVSEKIKTLRESPYRDHRAWVVQNLFTQPVRYDPFTNPLSLKEALNQIKKQGKAIDENLIRLSAAPIQISTVHRAKGLEFDIVIIASANKRNYPLSTAEIEESIAKETDAMEMIYSMLTNISNMRRTDLIALEKARLLYVALSRAKHGVIITTRKDQSFAKPFNDEFLLASYRHQNAIQKNANYSQSV